MSGVRSRDNIALAMIGDISRPKLWIGKQLRRVLAASIRIVHMGEHAVCFKDKFKYPEPGSKCNATKAIQET